MKVLFHLCRCHEEMELQTGKNEKMKFVVSSDPISDDGKNITCEAAKRFKA